MDHPPLRARGLSRLAAAALAAGLAACAAPAPQPAAVAPVAVVDLARVGRLGILDFTAQGDKSLEPVARERLVAVLRSEQPGATVRELGAPPQVLASVGRSTFDAETIRAIGQRYQLDALLVAELRADEMDPYRFMREARAAGGAVEIAGALELRIFETRSGAMIWTMSASSHKPITRMKVSAWGVKSADAGHIDAVRLELVHELVARVTADFRPVPRESLAGSGASQPPAALPVPAKAAGRD